MFIADTVLKHFRASNHFFLLLQDVFLNTTKSWNLSTFVAKRKIITLAVIHVIIAPWPEV